MLRDRTEYRFQERLKILALAAEMHVGTSGGCGHGRKTSLVEMRLHIRAGLIPDRATPFVQWQRDQIALRGTDADRVDLQAISLCRVFGRSQGIPLKILAIRYQYQDPVASRMAVKRRPRRKNRARDVGPASRNGVNIDGIQRLVERAIVERQRTDEKSAPGERHDADSVAVQLPCHVIYRQLCSRQSIGVYIACQHTSRRVDRKHHLIAAAVDLLPVVSKQRAGERRAKTEYR